MATLTAYYPADMTFQKSWTMEVPPQSISATQIKLAFGFHEMVMGGSAFNFPSNGLPTGTLTSSQEYGLDENGNLVLHSSATGMNVNFNTYVSTLYPAGTGIATQASYMAAMGVMFASADTVTGSSGDDVLYSFGGNDSINCGTGNDFCDAGAGNDIINGGAGIDTASYGTATAAVSVNLALTTQQNTRGAGLDTLTSIENLQGSDFNDRLFGNALANKLEGGAGNDTLKGLAGNDIIDGGAGNDTITGGAGRDGLTGGAGRDTFVFTALSDSPTYLARDLILDFTTGTAAGAGDRIDLRLIDANTTVAGDQAFSSTILMNSTSFTAVGQLRESGGVLYANTDADLATAEFVLDLNGNTSGLVAGNFLL